MKIKLETQDIDGEKCCSSNCDLISRQRKEVKYKRQSYYDEGDDELVQYTKDAYSCRYSKFLTKDFNSGDNWIHCCIPGESCLMSKFPIGEQIFEIGRTGKSDNPFAR